MTVVGGREIHPINVRVGGFYRAPREARACAARRDARAGARDRARDGALGRGLRLPRLRAGLRARRARRAGRVPDRTRAGSSRTAGSTSPSPSTTSTSSRSTSPCSNALHSRLVERRRLPLRPARPLRARTSTGSRRSRARRRTEAGLEPSERNPFRSIVVRAVELVYACDEALRLIAEYEEPDAPAVEVEPRAGVGYGCTEAPRGMLYHRYELDDEGTILDAKIVPPTSQNQRTIEEDLRGVVERSLDVRRRRARAAAASRRSATTTPASPARRTS